MEEITGTDREGLGNGCRSAERSKSHTSNEQLIRHVLLAASVGVLLVSGYLDVEAQTKYNDARIANATNAIMTYLEGTFGALVMAAAGIGAILSAAFGQYRASLSLMVVAVGAFILRSLMSTFFNDENVMQ